MSATVLLTKLACQRTQDNSEDEAYLNYNGERVWGPEDMNDGWGKDIGVQRPIFGKADVDLFDQDDFDADDHLGRITIREEERGQGDRSQEFTRDANYTLFYRVF